MLSRGRWFRCAVRNLFEHGRSPGNPAAIQAASAARMASPSAGPFSTPRLMKSAALSGNTGAVQRAGKVASVYQSALLEEAFERAQPSSA